MKFVTIVLIVIIIIQSNLVLAEVDLSRYSNYLRQQTINTFNSYKAHKGQNTYMVKKIDNTNFDVPLESLPGPKQLNLPTSQKDWSNNPFKAPINSRIPKELQPMFSERKYPKQGISLCGNTGAILIPSPGVLEPEKMGIAVHIIPFDLYNMQDVKFTDQDYYDTYIHVSFGAIDGFEIGIDKVFSNQDRYSVNEPVYINAKYQVPGNITLGGSFCTDSQAGYHSVWIAAGVPALWVGVGSNFGASNYKFYYNGYTKLKKAKFGGYNYDYSKAEGYADPVYFFVGGSFPIGGSTNFIYDFNGDKFSLGLRYNYQNAFYIDAAYISDGDYERLPGSISPKRMKNFIFGSSIVW